MARHTISPLILLGLAAPIPLAAQAPTNLAPGARVRVEAPTVTDARATGSLASIDATALNLTLEDGGNLTVPREALQSIAVSTGRRSHWVRGAGIGALVGFVFSGTVVIADMADDDPEVLKVMASPFYAAFMVVTTAGGALVGGITGALIRTEQWEAVPTSDVQWGAGPVAGGGVGFSLSLRF